LLTGVPCTMCLWGYIGGYVPSTLKNLVATQSVDPVSRTQPDFVIGVSPENGQGVVYDTLSRLS
jgi:hypothetical protein